eukprot:7145499-Alexandrium_andersonii.AAC.1
MALPGRRRRTCSQQWAMSLKRARSSSGVASGVVATRPRRNFSVPSDCIFTPHGSTTSASLDVTS